MNKKILAMIFLSLLGVSIWVVAKTLSRKPENTSEVFKRMSDYRQMGKLDSAIAVGSAWISEHPQNGSNDQVLARMAVLSLEKAKTDTANREKYVAQAIGYRDKMLPVASDSTLGWYSLGALQDAAAITESAGDLSDKQRCMQYRNALKLLGRAGYILSDKQTQISSPENSGKDRFGYKREDAQRMLDEVNNVSDRIRTKEQKAACN